jgi:hypothetical protein
MLQAQALHTFYRPYPISGLNRPRVILYDISRPFLWPIMSRRLLDLSADSKNHVPQIRGTSRREGRHVQKSENNISPNEISVDRPTPQKIISGEAPIRECFLGPIGAPALL